MESEVLDIQPQVTVAHLDVHPSQDAIVVHCDVDAVVQTEHGEPIIVDSKASQKVINVRGLSGRSDLASLARDVIMRGGLDPGYLMEVEQLLLYLKNRQLARPAQEDSFGRQRKNDLEVFSDTEPKEKANLSEVDEYLELLYDDLPSKVRGATMVLQLARIPDNLQEIANRDGLVLALVRVFRDDWKKSLDLAINIVYIFFCFTTFTQFHSLIAQHKVGSMCMSVIEHEIKRYQQLTDDMEVKRKNAKSSSASSEARRDYERIRKKYQIVIAKQETLLRLALYLLLNLSEDITVELKMRNKNIIPLLMTLLERKTPELVIMAVTFLKKLSIFQENKQDMANQSILKKLIRLIPHEHEILLNMTLRLLLNLSFDLELCETMIKEGLLPKLVTLLNNESERILVLCILYHISISEKCRPMFSLTDCIPMLMKMVLSVPEEPAEAEVVALGINLACHPLNAQKMSHGPGLKLLMAKAVKTSDALVLKMIRNISQHQDQSLKRQFLDYIPLLGTIIQQSTDDQMQLEALGILGNLVIADLNYLKIVEEFNLMQFISQKLKNLATEDDVILEVIILIGTLSIDEETAVMLTESGILDLLINLLRAKQEDDELVLQVVYVFYQLTLHQQSLQKLISESQACDYLLELMDDKNKEVSKTCNKALDVIIECDAGVAQKVQMERFRWHNYQWLNMITGECLPDDTEMYLEEAEELDPYYHLQMADILEVSEPYDTLEEDLSEVHPLAYATPVDMQSFCEDQQLYTNQDHLQGHYDY